MKVSAPRAYSTVSFIIVTSICKILNIVSKFYFKFTFCLWYIDSKIQFLYSNSREYPTLLFYFLGLYFWCKPNKNLARNIFPWLCGSALKIKKKYARKEEKKSRSIGIEKRTFCVRLETKVYVTLSNRQCDVLIEFFLSCFFLVVVVLYIFWLNNF